MQKPTVRRCWRARFHAICRIAGAHAIGTFRTFHWRFVHWRRNCDCGVCGLLHLQQTRLLLMIPLHNIQHATDELCGFVHSMILSSISFHETSTNPLVLSKDASLKGCCEWLCSKINSAASSVCLRAMRPEKNIHCCLTIKQKNVKKRLRTKQELKMLKQNKKDHAFVYEPNICT